MIRQGHTSVPIQHREDAQHLIASRLGKAQTFLHALEVHLACARKVNAHYVGGGSVGDGTFPSSVEKMAERMM